MRPHRATPGLAASNATNARPLLEQNNDPGVSGYVNFTGDAFVPLLEGPIFVVTVVVSVQRFDGRLQSRGSVIDKGLA